MHTLSSYIWMSYISRMVEVALVVLAAWLLSGVVVGHDATQKRSHLSSNIPATKPVQQGIDTHDLRHTPLFGEVPVQKASPKLQPVEERVVANSRLNIKLIGTVVAGEKSAAMLVASSSKKQAVYFLGEDIQPGVRLEKVKADAIVVMNHGKRERIHIVAAKPIQQAAVSPQPRKHAVAPQIPIMPQESRKIDRQRLHSQMRNFSTLLSQARVSPHFNNGKPDGFKISEIVKGSLYEEIGLRNGDIIKSVNGETVTGAEQAMRMYRELQSATFIDVEVERNGRLQQLSYVIQ